MSHSAYDHCWTDWIDNPGTDEIPPDEVWDMDDGHSCEWLVYVRYRGETDYFVVNEAHKLDWRHTGSATDILQFCLEIDEDE